MRAHLVQFDIAWEDKSSNHETVREMLSGADPEKGDLVVLPEMFDTGFSLNTETTSDADGATLGFLGELASAFGVFLQGGRTLAGEGDRLATNRAVIVGPDGSLLDEYAKIHPFTFGREPERFTGGERVITYEWAPAGGRALTVCPAVCYDLRFPELFREGLAMGAEVIAIGANWPSARQAHWRALLIARAIEDQCYALGVNRTGSDPHLSYLGGTIAVDPKGAVIGELGEEVGVLSVEIDPGALDEWRETFPAWRDARLPHAAPRPVR